VGILDEMVKGATGAAAGKGGLGQSLGLEPQHGALADAVLGMLTSGERGGLPGLQQSLQSKGLGDVVSSWIGTGRNQPVAGHELESALGSTVVQQLAAKAGIDPRMASAALATVLPLVVDKLTPHGSVPAQQSMLDIAAGLLAGRR
jgi:uncharacterized protein YidB (DUF937 family)